MIGNGRQLLLWRFVESLERRTLALVMESSV